LLQALVLALRAGAARPGFGHTLLESPPPDALEGVTLWLAELAQTALDVVLFIDEVERLPEDSARGADLFAAQRAAQPARGAGGA
jgi:LuxR family maltose regulon positive regulatory protein